MAFASIKEDLAHLYTISYYPKLNQNRGLAHDFREAGGSGDGEISGAHQRRVSAAGTGDSARGPGSGGRADSPRRLELTF